MKATFDVTKKVGWFPASVEIKNAVKAREKEITNQLTATGQISRRL